MSNSPLGRKVPKPVTPEPEWKTYPQNPALEVNAKGQLRTKPQPLPDLWPFPVIAPDIDLSEP